MLPTHGRYDYANITTRPDYDWPDGKRLAVYVALNVEAFSFGMGKGAAIAPPDQPLVCPIWLHPLVAGRSYRIRRLRRAFEHIAAHRDRIWLTRPGDICAHIESPPSGTVPE